MTQDEQKYLTEIEHKVESETNLSIEEVIWLIDLVRKLDSQLDEHEKIDSESFYRD